MFPLPPLTTPYPLLKKYIYLDMDKTMGADGLSRYKKSSISVASVVSVVKSYLTALFLRCLVYLKML